MLIILLHVASVLFVLKLANRLLQHKFQLNHIVFFFVIVVGHGLTWGISSPKLQISSPKLFSQTSLYLINILSSFIKKFIHLILSKCLLYTLIFGRNMIKGPTFLVSLKPMKYLDLCLSKETFIDTTIFSTSI